MIFCNPWIPAAGDMNILTVGRCVALKTAAWGPLHHWLRNFLVQENGDAHDDQYEQPGYQEQGLCADSNQ
jgi:hypothetical protein